LARLSSGLHNETAELPCTYATAYYYFKVCSQVGTLDNRGNLDLVK